MSKTVATFIGVVSMVIFLHAFRAMHKSNIIGNVFSPEGSVWVYAINGKDSLKTMVNNGKFNLTVKPGSWKVLIANSNMLRDEGVTVEVEQGSTMDLGTIKLN
jgi:hypothetical protein